MSSTDHPIGGEFELSAAMLAPAVAAKGFVVSLPPITLATGRTALRMIARCMYRENRREVLLPSYLCPSILQPFREESIAIRFYRIREDLGIDVEDLSARVRERRPGAVLFIHYFGFPPAPEALEMLGALRESCWIIEDRAHGSVLESCTLDANFTGHFVLTSFRKYLPLPDGGFILNRSGANLPPASEADAAWIERRLEAKLLRYPKRHAGHGEAVPRVIRSGRAGARHGKPVGRGVLGFPEPSRPDRPDRRHGAEAPEFRHSPRRVQRRQVLAQSRPPAFRDSSRYCLASRLSPPRGSATTRRVPRTARSTACLLPRLLPLPRKMPLSQFPEAGRLSAQILGLPVDQRYGDEPMMSLLERIAESWTAPR